MGEGKEKRREGRGGGEEKKREGRKRKDREGGEGGSCLNHSRLVGHYIAAYQGVGLVSVAYHAT